MDKFSRRIKRTVLMIFALLTTGGLVLTAPNLPAAAQTALTVEISPLNIVSFPKITTLMDVYDASGRFVNGISPSAVTVLEDGQAIPVTSLQEALPGVQFVLAVSPSPALAARDGEGVSRYAKIREVLVAWGQSQTSDNHDDLSLVSTTGTIVSHQGLNTWVPNLAGYEPDSRNGEPGIEALNLAMDVVEQSTPQPGMKRAILFISSYLPRPAQTGLESIIQRAKQSRTRIYVWHVDSPNYYDTTGAKALNDLALQTGGEYFTYSGIEQLPDIEGYFTQLRHLYIVEYISRANQGGEHKVTVQVDIDGQQAVSGEEAFAIDVQAPSAVLLSPPAQITRETDPDDKYNLETLSPSRQELKLLIEFPDKFPRPLVRTTLFVDGVQVAENTTEPFDVFTWDISSYRDNAQHLLAVEVEDSLGLKRTSFSVPVVVTVIQPPTGLTAFIDQNRDLLVTIAVVMAGFILLIAILVGGRMLPASAEARRKARKAAQDPVTQPVIVQPDRGRQASKPTPSAPFSWLTNKSVAAPAYLAKLTYDGQPAPGAPIPLAAREMTFGIDPVQSTNILDDPTIAALHCRIRMDERGNYHLYDQNSISGTWVNYEPVGREGCRLEHGDTIHIGTVMFRFVLRKAPNTPRPRVLPEVRE